MIFLLRSAAALALPLTLVFSALHADHAIKATEAGPPKELNEAIQTLLSPKAVTFLDAGGQPVAEIWLRKEIPANATPEQVKNGLTYREIAQTELFGAVRILQPFQDYRKQPIKAGVYTLRLAYQPQDGDHMGTSPYPEFLVLISASKDARPTTMEPKQMIELSAGSIGTAHPAVLLLFPHAKHPAPPELAARPGNHQVLLTHTNVTVGGKKADRGLGIGLALVGHAE